MMCDLNWIVERVRGKGRRVRMEKASYRSKKRDADARRSTHEQFAGSINCLDKSSVY